MAVNQYAMIHIDNALNSWDNYDDYILSYLITLRFDAKNAHELIRQFSVEFIKSCHRHQLLLNPNWIDVEESLLAYQSLHAENTNSAYPIFADLYRMSHGGRQYYYTVSTMSFYDLSSIVTYKVLAIANRLRKHSFTPYALIFPDDSFSSAFYFAFVPLRCSAHQPVIHDGFVKFTISLISHSSIWFERTQTNFGQVHDNRLLAYRNTPRLNSFLRDIYALVQQMGGKWFYESEGKRMHYNMGWDYEFPFEEAYNDHCVPLGGKIIYQEDIDEGRVILPTE